MRLLPPVPVPLGAEQERQAVDALAGLLASLLTLQGALGALPQMRGSTPRRRRSVTQIVIFDYNDDVSDDHGGKPDALGVDPVGMVEIGRRLEARRQTVAQWHYANAVRAVERLVDLGCHWTNRSLVVTRPSLSLPTE
jgi:hypothetical protein